MLHRYKYELEQGEKTKKAKSSVVETKEVKLTPKTDDNDVSIKLKSTQKFLDKVGGGPILSHRAPN